ncbi:alpha/beta hydrolase [Actinomadura fulvescens]|uniref:Alpha/beta hydrolase n=1 Tax=Actinomadura fulvescens TaxID=46160 RepID=A0ABN3PGL3_9ACTN
MPEVSAGGVRFHIQRLPGSPGHPVVVFLHGLVLDNLSSFYYTLAGPVSRAGAEVVMYDLRGHGRSERPSTGYGTATAVTDLAAVLAAAGVDRPVHLVGNSYGGVIALRAALDRPDLVAGLALIEAHCTGDWIDRMTDTLTVSALGLEHDRVAEQLRGLGARKEARMAATADALLNRTSLIEDVAATPAFGPAELGAVRCPVLAVYGERSELADAGRDLDRHIRDCTVHILPGLAHTVLREATDLVTGHLLGWLARVAWPERVAP